MISLGSPTASSQQISHCDDRWVSANHCAAHVRCIKSPEHLSVLGGGSLGPTLLPARTPAQPASDVDRDAGAHVGLLKRVEANAAAGLLLFAGPMVIWHRDGGAREERAISYRSSQNTVAAGKKLLRSRRRSNRTQAGVVRSRQDERMPPKLQQLGASDGCAEQHHLERVGHSLMAVSTSGDARCPRKPGTEAVVEEH